MGLFDAKGTITGSFLKDYAQIRISVPMAKEDDLDVLRLTYGGIVTFSKELRAGRGQGN